MIKPTCTGAVPSTNNSCVDSSPEEKNLVVLVVEKLNKTWQCMNHRTVEHPELEGTHKDHLVQLLAPDRSTQKFIPHDEVHSQNGS